jgi:hypothetical protein
MRLALENCLAVLLMVAVRAPCAERHLVSPLSRPVSHFSVGKTSVMDALLWLGHDQGVCFGIEFSGPQLSRDVQVTADQTTVGELVKKILGSAGPCVLSVSDGVILIRKRDVRPPAWLDRRLPQFDVPRTELFSADIALWMTLERQLDPSIKGFAGDSPVTEPVDEVGPFQERGRTVRQLLVKIVGSSRGASWFPSTYGIRFSFPASINRFWTLVTYSSPNATRPK